MRSTKKNFKFKKTISTKKRMQYKNGESMESILPRWSWKTKNERHSLSTRYGAPKLQSPEIIRFQNKCNTVRVIVPG